MKGIKLFLLSFLLLVFKTVSVEAKVSGENLNQKLHDKIEQLIKTHNITGVNVGVWIPGKAEWTESFGVANKATGEKMNLSNHFRIGSLTKTFVGTAILMLVDQKKITLEDKISKYVSNVPGGDKITIRQLANMTSGLASYSENEEWVTKAILTKNDHRLTAQELLDVAFQMPVIFAPGKGWHYSNTNTVLLGLVIEKASGQSLGKYLENNIFIPLGLKNTSYPEDEKMPTPYAHGYSRQTLDGKEEDVTYNDPSWANAAGQIISTFADLKVWAESLGTGALLSAESFKERMKWVSPGSKKQYGFAVGINNGWITHTGSLPGYNCMVAYLPANKGVLVVMVNEDIEIIKNKKPNSPTDILVEAITKIVTPQNVWVMK